MIHNLEVTITLAEYVEMPFRLQDDLVLLKEAEAEKHSRERQRRR